jgi:hypothetical protein
MYTEAQFVELMRPPIENGDETLISLIGPHVDAALISKRCTRASLARKVLDAFPDSRLAERIATMIYP